MTEEDEVNETVTMPPMRPVDVAERNEAEPRSTETVFEIQGLTARYGSNIAVKDVNLDIPQEPDHRRDRARRAAARARSSAASTG